MTKVQEKATWACPICGPLPLNCPCSAAEKDMYLEIERLRLTDEERAAIVHLCNHAKWSDGCDDLDAAAATIVEGFLKRLGE